MKRIINLILSAAVLFVVSVSCEKGPDVVTEIVAEWHLTQMTDYQDSNLPDVYITFNADKSFEVYQKVGDVSRYRKYVGTYTVEGALLKGEYADGEDWGSVYRVSFEADGSVLVLTSVVLDETGGVASEHEVCKYVKEALGESEKENSDLITKSESSSFLPFL